MNGIYQVSNYGRVKSLKRKTYRENRYGNTFLNHEERILRNNIRKDGYVNTTLYKDGKPKSYAIHRLVAQHFLLNPNNYKEINHKDENKTNNCVTNLEWCTGSENVKHSWNNGLEKVTNRMREHCKEIFNKKIYQYSKQGELMKEWESASQAGRELNIFQQSIVNNLKGRSKTAGGFVWKYRKE